MATKLPANQGECELLIDILCHRALSSPNQVAYRFLTDNGVKPQTITYGELDKKARALAAELQKNIELVSVQF